MIKCSICGWRVGTIRCRRCNKMICKECYKTHGLCKECYETLARVSRNAL